MRPLFFALISIFLLPLAQAEVRVAFIELRDPHGKLIELEPGGRFGHVAISQGAKWVHAYPGHGVEYTSLGQLEKIGQVGEILTLSGRAELRSEDVSPYLGKKYDFRYSWTDAAIYCSELVGKLLGLQPEPMDFSAEHWRQDPVAAQAKGELGLSPDDLYRLLKPEALKAGPN